MFIVDSIFEYYYSFLVVLQNEEVRTLVYILLQLPWEIQKLKIFFIGERKDNIK